MSSLERWFVHVWPYVHIEYLMCDRELEPLRFYALALVALVLCFFFWDEKYVWFGFSVPVIPSLHYELNERNHHKFCELRNGIVIHVRERMSSVYAESTQTFNFCQFFSWHTCAIS